MANPDPKWENNKEFLRQQRPKLDPSQGPLVKVPICFKAWADLHQALKKLPNKQKWLRDTVYAAARAEGLL